MEKQYEPTRRTYNQMRDTRWLAECYPDLPVGAKSLPGSPCADKPFSYRTSNDGSWESTP